MTTKFYDVVVLGAEIAPLAAGALLAKRGFRVLVVGNGSRRDRYDCYGFVFARRPFILTSADSPVIRRVIAELGAGQLWQHCLRVPSPVYQVVLPRARIDVFSDHHTTLAEVRRELPEVADLAEQLFAEIAAKSGDIDKLFSNDLVLPAGSFFERRELSRALVQNPFRAGVRSELTRATNSAEPLGQVLGAPEWFDKGADTRSSSLVRFRTIAGWLFGAKVIEGGRDELCRLLEDLIVSQGGDLAPRQRVAEIAAKNGKVIGVRLAGRDEPTGCRAVITAAAPRDLATLLAPVSWTKRWKAAVETPISEARFYAVNLGVDREVIPAGLAHTCFVRLGEGLGADMLRIERIPQTDPSKAALHVACHVPQSSEQGIDSGALRDAILDRLRWLFPFLDNHVNVIHSPYDHFGPLDLTGRAEGNAPPVPHLEEVERWTRYKPNCESELGCEGSPHRTGIDGVLLAGDIVVRGLGLEGELLAAWGAARLASKIDPNRGRLAKTMRTAVEM